MQPPLEVTWLDASETVNLVDLSHISGMSASELGELVEYGALSPLESNAQGCIFSAVCIVPLRTVCKLRLDFDLDVFTVAVLMGYLERIDALELQVRSLQSQLLPVS